MKYLLQEDDCAPDARVYFDKEMKELIGLSLDDFSKRGTQTSEQDGYFLKKTLNGYCIECSADDPYWKLSKVEIAEDLPPEVYGTTEDHPLKPAEDK